MSATHGTGASAALQASITFVARARAARWSPRARGAAGLPSMGRMGPGEPRRRIQQARVDVNGQLGLVGALEGVHGQVGDKDLQPSEGTPGVDSPLGITVHVADGTAVEARVHVVDVPHLGRAERGQPFETAAPELSGGLHARDAKGGIDEGVRTNAGGIGKDEVLHYGVGETRRSAEEAFEADAEVERPNVAPNRPSVALVLEQCALEPRESPAKAGLGDVHHAGGHRGRHGLGRGVFGEVGSHVPRLLQLAEAEQ